MNDQQNQTHLFALYAPSVVHAVAAKQSELVISDGDLVHRMVKVLRFAVGDRCILFGKAQHVTIEITEISKKNIVAIVQSVQNHEPATPEVTFFLPMLKKDALEQAVYSLCELGINKIQLVVTQKSRQQLFSDKEFERLQGIVIAAAEQSKHYACSELLKPQMLQKIMQENSMDQNIVFDPAGVSFFSIREKFLKNSESRIGLLVGPEAGLTDQELKALQKNKFISCALTSTILRAVQAVALAAGLVRLR